MLHERDSFGKEASDGWIATSSGGNGNAARNRSKSMIEGTAIKEIERYFELDEPIVATRSLRAGNPLRPPSSLSL